MSDAIWWPGILALAAGLLVGWGFAVRLGRDSKAKKKRQNGNLALKIQDLERRRDELYERLRQTGPEAPGPGDREALEIAAARTLRELDLLQAHLPTERKKKAAERAPAAPPEPAPSGAAPAAASPPAVGLAGRHPFLVGFAFGAGMLALVGLLIYWAGRDAQPAPQTGMAGAERSAAEGPPHPTTSEGLPPEVVARIEELRARYEDEPKDLLAHKELALALLATTQYFEAFELAQKLLETYPDDPDGLYIQGVVRLSMGQYDLAIELLDRVLAQYPNHLQALLYRGLALYQSGRTEPAIDTWEAGLELAGGRHPDLENLLAMARGGGGVPAPSPPGPPAAAGSDLATDGYPVRLELGSGAGTAPGATLFLFLRAEEGGAPVAVKRVSNPIFPMELVLGPGDIMMEGDEIPDDGLLVARLDRDGSVSTQDDQDLEAQAAARRGALTRLVLAD